MTRRTTSQPQKILENLSSYCDSQGSKCKGHFPKHVEEAPDSSPTQEKAFLHSLVACILEMLSPDERDIFELRICADWTFKELTAITRHRHSGSTNRTFQAILARVRATLLSTLLSLESFGKKERFIIYVPEATRITGADLWAVSIPGHEKQFVGTPPTAEDLIRYQTERIELLMGQEMFFSGSISDDVYSLDIKKVSPAKSLVIQFGKLHDQQTILNLKTQETVYIDTHKRKAV